MSSALLPFQAYAFKVGNRWLYGVNKRGHVKTAWSLAGAKLFSSEKDADAFLFSPRVRQPRASVERVLVTVQLSMQELMGGVN